MLRILVPLLVATLPLPLAAQAPRKKTPAPKPETLSGCVDQKQGKYVLTDDSMLKTLALLEWVDQDQENFARYVGHKVTVTGRRDPRSDPPVFKVAALKNVSDVCAP
jgi:hypothetical protein